MIFIAELVGPENPLRPLAGCSLPLRVVGRRFHVGQCNANVCIWYGNYRPQLYSYAIRQEGGRGRI